MMVDKEALYRAIGRLPPEKLEQVSEFVEHLNSEEQKDPDWFRKLYDQFAPVRAEIAASGMTDEEVNQIIDEAIREIREERRAKQQPD